ncbi:MAG: hypothetical protein ACD_73C00346G0003 [uncultured bacterium]|nr:MAG: hypothetical protein ACD_73C00346G0003 [uncultured bacterium]
MAIPKAMVAITELIVMVGPVVSICFKMRTSEAKPTNPKRPVKAPNKASRHPMF